jgi:hypothetical protein
MNLYAVGCSFTHGHGVLPGPSNKCLHKDFMVNTYGKFDYAWPWQLQPYFDTVINDAYQGAGNDYVLRRTVRMLAHLQPAELADWIFVIQITQPQRKEFLDGSENMFYKPLYHTLDSYQELDFSDTLCFKDCAVYAQHEECNKTTQTLDHTQKHFASGFYYNCWDDEYMMYEQLKDLLLLTEVLERRHCKYLITGMSAMYYKLEPIAFNYNINNSYTHNYMQLLDTANHVECFSEILLAVDPKQVSHVSACKHPNKQGHKVIADYILDEIKQRGWL